MNTPINFLVDHVGASHMAFYLIEEANKLSGQGSNITIFYDQLQRPCRRLLVPAMMLIEAWAQPGVSIATSISTAARLLKFPGPSTKMFYVWDMSWLRNPKRVGPFTELFRNSDLSLIARCKDHAEALENAFNVEVPYIIKDFDHEAILEAVSHDRTAK